MGHLYLLCHLLLLPISGHPPKDTLSYIIIPGLHHTYGYDILRNGRMLIHQPSIPCKPGFDGFSTEKDARKVALLVLEKLKKGVMPPSVTLEEIKAGGVNLPLHYQ
jgi:hypothetical protein